MPDNSSNNKRIAKNTVFLYFRMILTMLIGLYLSRVVLQVLGASDYGLYNVVGGVIVMFGFLNTTLSAGTQRFLNIEIGTGNKDRLKDVFSTALIQHVLLAGLILVLGESIGLWFVCNKLNIPEGRELAVMWVYQFSVLTACVNIIQVPFMSTIIAHERMNVYAYISIFDVLFKLLIALSLPLIPLDKLIIYASFIFIVHLADAILYNNYCQRHFEEARFRFVFIPSLFKGMLNFSGWNLVGSFAVILNNYGLNIVFNLFFGTIVNAARGIAFQVNSLVQQFSSNFQLAVKPQIVNYWAQGKKQDMNNLAFNASKYSAMLLFLIAIPIAVEIEFLLNLWLGDYPDWTVPFVRIVLLQTSIYAMTGPILMIVQASGYLKSISISAGLLNLTLLPINYLLMKIGCSPQVAFLVNFIGSCLETLIETLWLKHYIDFPVGRFYKEVYMKVIVLAIVMFAIPYSIHNMIQWDNNIIRFLVVSMCSFITSFGIFWSFGLSKGQRASIHRKINILIKHK